MMERRIEIRTPEGIVFSRIPAGPVIRFAAWFIDLVVILTSTIAVGMLAGLIGVISIDLAGAFQALTYFAISIGYGIFCEWLWRGQTVGKRMLRLRVVDAEAHRLKFNQIVIRNLLRFVDSLPLAYFVGGVSCWLTRCNQRLGDIAANTIVVHIPRLSDPDVDQLLPDKFNSLRAYPHLAARLRQLVDPDEAALALQALLRCDDFEPRERAALFAELAGCFRAKVRFPDEALDGISDERHVRNVVDVVFRTRTGSRVPELPGR